MNVATRAVLIGMTFGDAYVSVRKRPIHKTYISSELSCVHSVKQEDYCRYKADLLGNAFGRKINVRKIKHGPGKKYDAFIFSISHPYLKQIRGWCYPGGKKTYTTQTLQMLTPQGIALWYMDDGSARVNINKSGYVSSVATEIATMCSIEEANIICEYFDNEFGIKFNKRFHKRSGFYIQANTENSRYFAHLVEPFIIPSMKYKLAHVADLSSHECRAPVAQCNCGSNIYSKRRGGLCDSCYSRKIYKNRKPVMI